MGIVGWAIVIVAVFLALSWAYGMRIYARQGHGISQQTVNTTMLWFATLIAILILSLSPFHLLWLFPLAWLIGTLSLAFPFSLLSIPGHFFSSLCCIGLHKNRAGGKLGGRIWQQFEGRSNDKLTLREKAQVLAPVLLQIAGQHEESLVKGALSSIGKDRQGQIFFECLIIDLFILDRLAFAVLGVEKRPWFMVPLLQEVFGRLGAPSDDDKDVEEMREAFGRLYHDRVHQYASCQFAARPNERGGYDIDNTVGWKLGENLGVDDMTKMHIELDIASHYITVAKNLQLRELIAGY